MPSFHTHTVRFFIPEPKAIHCGALNNDTKKLAISRSDNSVELWDVGCALALRGAPVLQARLPAAPGASVEALAWCAGRLFSTGLHGHLLEHGGHGLEATASTAVSGGAAWCMAAEPSRHQLAAGTEDGQVVLHRLGDEGLVFERKLTKQERRILSVAWHPDGRHLAAGSVNTACLHDVETGALLSRIAVGRRPGRRETLVWSVALLSDMTLVTGDSRGRVSFWNGRLGALHISLSSHKADVLAVAVGAGGDAVFAAGVDPTIARFDRVVGARGAAASWVRSTRVQLHVRDVRVLIGADRWLISAGVDAALVFDMQGSNKDTIRTSPLPQLGNVLPAPALPTRLRLHRLDVSGPRPSLQRVRSLPAPAAGAAHQLRFTPDAGCGCGTRVLLHDDSGVCALDAAAGEEGGLDKKRARSAKGRRKVTEVDQPAGPDNSVVITDKYRHLLYLGSLGEDQLLAVEAPAARVEEKLPPALRRKRYGVA
ncbi:U3 small nucleolar RNA-associated protein 4 homolog [Pollicipes pollicipes]|uniref:U3 small nucleolar RNA-associated protein 4 homolog n=1 Tax=Pollicipes pollicipes TaxID=41117 RepID=UPI001884E34A|nr:U3 small nucleolar RNA-associated protein 4 homolog [Pollicipes pollicipes]